MKKIIFLASIILAGLFVGCSEDDSYDVEYASTFPISGDWIVKQAGDDGVYGDATYHLMIYNTALDNGKEVWIQNFLGGKDKAKINANVTNKSISMTNLVTLGEDTIVNLTGNIIEQELVDSIYFTVEFTSKGKTTKYKVAGHRETGFEDEH